MYFGGEGVDLNYEEDVKWLSVSAENGDNPMFKGVLVSLLFCLGVIEDERNYIEAFKWAKIASDKGFIYVDITLGFFIFKWLRN